MILSKENGALLYLYKYYTEKIINKLYSKYKASLVRFQKNFYDLF